MAEEATAAPAEPAGELTARDAAALLSTPPPKDTNEPATSEEDVSAAPEESGDEPDAGPEAVPGESEDSDPADEPSIERPRSWAKEHDEAFKALPRHLQQIVADSERAREADFLRRQNEAAERSRAAEAKEQAAEQARLQYEQALPLLLQQVHGQINAKFQDIKSWDDVQKMAREDPIRYMEWDADQKRAQALANEARSVQGRQQQQAQQKFQAFVEAQNKLAQEKIPELRDPAKAAALRDEARAYLSKDLGFSDGELQGLSAGSWQLSGLDHRVQVMLWKAMAYDKAKKAAKAPTPKPVPPVQRPNAAPDKGAARQAQIKDLSKQLDQTGSARDAAKLYAARLRRA